MRLVGRIVALFFGGVFLLLLVAGVGTALESQSIVDNYVRVEGVVAEVDQSAAGGGDLEFTAIIRYTTRDGDAYQFRSSVTSNSRPGRDTPIDVLYDPSNPQDAIEDTFAALWMLPAVMMAIGTVGLFIVGFVVVRSFRRPRKADKPPRPAFLDRGTETVSATFSHVQPRGPDDKGRFQYRVVAVRKVDGVRHTYHSDWLEENPTVAIMAAGNQLPVRLNSDGTGEVVVPPSE